jgi:hypothetical protein
VADPAGGDLNAGFHIQTILRLIGGQMPLRPSVATFPTPRPVLALDRIMRARPAVRLPSFAITPKRRESPRTIFR